MPRREIFSVCCVTAAYLLFAGAGLSVAFVHGTVSPVWPASGLAIAALTLWGLPMWPAITVGAFLANYLIAQDPIAVAAGIAVGNTLEGLLGAAILKRFRVCGEVSNITDALAIIGAAVFAPAPSATMGVVSLVLGGFLPWEGAFDAGIVWWVGDLMGILLGSSLILAWMGSSASPEHVPRPAEFIGTVLAAVGLMCLVFMSNPTTRLDLILPPVDALLFLPVLWAILRLRPREALTVLALGCMLAIFFTAFRVDQGAIGQLLGLQVMTFATSAATLVMLGAITDRIRTQMALGESRAQVSQALERVSDTLAQLSYALKAGNAGTFHWNAQTNENVWSDELLALYGLHREEFGGRHEDWLESLVPEHREAGNAAVETSLKTGDFNLDFQIKRRDNGEIRWLAGRAKVYFDPSGKPVWMIGINTDITERKLMELSLTASEGQLNAIFEHAPIGIAYISLSDRRFLQINERLAAITGYDHAELVQMSALDIVLPEDRSIMLAEFDDLQRCSLRSSDTEKHYLKKDGRTIWARTSITALCNQARTQAAFAIALIEDVTEAKIADAERRDAERRLQLAVDIAELGAWEFDVGEDSFYVAPSWMARLGLDERDPGSLREQWQQRVHPDDLQRLLDYVTSYLSRPEGQYRIEYRFRSGNGSYRWISSRAVAEVDENGRLLKLIGTHLDITDRKREEQRIREESLHDPLTGLPNRGLILEYGKRLLSTVERSHNRCAVLFIDLDRFKPINDTYGHEAGDAVLKEVARRLRSSTRQEDLVGRLGGDEFAILLPHIDAEHRRVETVAQHVLNVVVRPIPVGELRLSVSPSIGISYFPDQGEDLETLLQKADVAMYRAKQDGRGTFHTYTVELERRADETIERKSKLHAALQGGHLILHYQPIMNLRTGRVVAAEALLRMVEEDGTIVGPSGVLPKAQSSELGADLDEWVLTAACQQHEKWIGEGLQPIPLSVNISPMQFLQSTFPEKLRLVLAKIGIDPGQLQLEVSEKCIEGGGATLDAFRQIKALGVKIALDGFGSAPFDLNQLSNLPIDCIKIEQSLVRGMKTAAASDAGSKLVIALGHMLKLDIVGEGIESEEMLRSVEEFGCDDAQGFYFSRPLPPTDFARWYRKCQVH